MHLVLCLVILVVVSDVLGQQRDFSASHHRRVKTREAQWTIIRDVSTDGSIAFPTRRPLRRRPFPIANPNIETTSTTTTTTAAPDSNPHQYNEDVQIPVSLFLNKTFNNLEDFMKNLVVKNEFRSAGFGSSSNAAGEAAVTFLRSNSAARTGGLALPANCDPQEMPVEMERPDDPSLIYFPRCTKIQRCGGCCPHDLLMCVPTRTELVDVNVIKARFIPETNSFEPQGMQPISLEKHLACECQCRVKAEDCNAKQDYRKEECRCICNNQHESKDCTGTNKFWDPQTCRCECRNNPDCSTGFFFDEHTCSCQPVRANGILFPRSGSHSRGHGQPTYEIADDDVESLESKYDTTSHSPWYISNIMRSNPVKRDEASRK